MSGIERIEKERTRQILKEGWTREHDQQHVDSELVMAAICYAAISMPLTRRIFIERPEHCFVDPWPREWAGRWDKRSKHRNGHPAKFRDAKAMIEYVRGEGRIRCLEIAGALIAAEIDRIEAEGGGG